MTKLGVRYLRKKGTLPMIGALLLAGILFLFGEVTVVLAQSRVRTNQPPVPGRVQTQMQQREKIYEGYARLFVLGHIMTRALGVPGLMPRSINLDLFAQQDVLAQAGDIYVYRPGKRDIMWPLIIPTPVKEPEVPPTSTPIPESVELMQETPTPTSSPTPTPTEVIPPPLKLQVVSHSKTGDLVVIDNQILTVGDSIKQATITKIGAHHAEIKYYGAKFFVTKEGTVKPEDFHEEELLFN